MSKVVVRHGLEPKHLVAVVTRTIHEEQYLRRLLGLRRADYRFAVEKHSSVFFRRAMFIREIDKQDGELHFEFTSRITGRSQPMKSSSAAAVSAFDTSWQPADGEFRPFP